MEMAMLMASGVLRERGASPRLHGSGADGLLRLAVALLFIAGGVLTLQVRGLHWLWALLT
jgi:hypothetical protein